MKFFAVSVLATVIALASVKADIGGDLISTLRIIFNLCGGAKDEPGVPEAFFDCYDGVPGESIFIECQLDIFGGVVDNLEQINELCADLGLIAPYSMCVQLGFAKAGLDLEESATLVNICQAQVVGIE